MKYKITLTYEVNKNGTSKCKLKLPLDAECVTILSALETGSKQIIKMLAKHCKNKKEINKILVSDLLKKEGLWQ